VVGVVVVGVVAVVPPPPVSEGDPPPPPQPDNTRQTAETRIRCLRALTTCSQKLREMYGGRRGTKTRRRPKFAHVHSAMQVT
jgi:hypothetical protein